MHRIFATLVLLTLLPLAVFLTVSPESHYVSHLNSFSVESEPLDSGVIESRMATSTPMPTATRSPQLRDETLLADTSLIDGEPCGPPCWRGITPGETSWRDAVTILQASPELDNVQTQEDVESDAVGAVWQPKGGTSCCQMVAEDGATVNLIFLRVTPDMTLGQVLEAHGEPAYAVGTPVTDDQAIVNLVYPDVPMIVLAFAAGPEGDITKDSEVVGVFYTTADDMQLFLQTNFLHNWSGFGEFSVYTFAEGANFEVTPSVTLTPTSARPSTR